MAIVTDRAAGSVDLNTLVGQAVSDAIQSDTIQSCVRQAAEKAVKAAIDDAFGYSSDFRKGIKSIVEQVLVIPSVNELTSFSHAVTEIIKLRLSNISEESAKHYLGTMLDSILPVGNVITLDELKKAYMDRCGYDASDGDGDDEEDFNGTLMFKESTTKGYYSFWCSPKPDVKQFTSDVEISMSFSSSVGDEAGLLKCYYTTLDGKEVKHGLFAGAMGAFEAMVFRLSTRVATLKIDPKMFEVNVSFEAKS